MNRCHPMIIRSHRCGMKYLNSRVWLAALTVVFMATSVHGSLVFTPIIGLEGRIEVIEDDHFDFVDYSVDILDSSTVAAFAVSNGGGSFPTATWEI